MRSTAMLGDELAEGAGEHCYHCCGESDFECLVAGFEVDVVDF